MIQAEEGVAPDNAWGPPGGGDRNLKKRENLSVVKQTLPPKSPVTREPQERPGDLYFDPPHFTNFTKMMNHQTANFKTKMEQNMTTSLAKTNPPACVKREGVDVATKFSPED